METSPAESTEFAQPSAERWRNAEGLEERSLLRLSILRDLVQKLHAQKSHCLASGKRSEAQALRHWENKIEGLREHDLQEGDLIQLLTRPTQLKKKSRVIPQALFNAIDREKLERYDRQWEATLAAESCRLGWNFWSLETAVEIPAVQEWNQRLADELWPHGLVLWAESAQSPKVGDENSPYWHGRWILLLHSRFHKPEDLPLNFGRWPGTADPSSSAIRWKLLFSSKKR